jgi:hypothetical protein
MASDVQYAGWNSKYHNLGNFQYFHVLLFYNAFVFLSAKWIKSIFCQMSQKWRFGPKWRIKIRFFDITLRVSNIFSIFFLHSLGVGKTQILLNGFFHSSRHLWWLEKLFFHKICVLPTPNERKKKIEKMLDTLRVRGLWKKNLMRKSGAWILSTYCKLYVMDL